jgi:transposase
MAAALVLLADWRPAAGWTHVAMERTGVSWGVVSNLLEGWFTLFVVNAQHITAVPGRKTDVKAAEWIAELRRHGLLWGGFIPAKLQRQLREFTQRRMILVQDRAINRMPSVLEDTHIKLASTVTAISGVSPRALLRALIAGHRDVSARADRHPLASGGPAIEMGIPSTSWCRASGTRQPPSGSFARGSKA